MDNPITFELKKEFITNKLTSEGFTDANFKIREMKNPAQNVIEFIKEELNDTPENYISIVLTEIKRKIDKIFDYKVKEPSDILSPDELKKKDSKKMSLIDFGIELESSEISKYSKLFSNSSCFFSLISYSILAP